MPRISAMALATSPSRLVVSKILEIHGELIAAIVREAPNLTGV